MSLETAQYIHQLNPSNPSGADYVKDGDDHLRMLKAALKATFPGIQGPIDPSVTHTFLSGLKSLLVPTGAITLWAGSPSAVPAGWAICDGRTVTASDGVTQVVTVNLAGRVPCGVGAGIGQGQAFGQSQRTATTSSAGDHSHSGATGVAGNHSHGGRTGDRGLSVDQMPPHRHLVARSGVYGDTLSASNFISETKVSGSNSEYRLTGNYSEPDIGQTSQAGSGQGHNHDIGMDGAHAHGLAIDGVGGHAHGVTVDVTQPSLGVYFIQKI